MLGLTELYVQVHIYLPKYGICSLPSQKLNLKTDWAGSRHLKELLLEYTVSKYAKLEI